MSVAPECCDGTTRQCQYAGIVDLVDLSALVNYLTGGGYVLPCPGEANVNHTGIIDLVDLSALVSYLNRRRVRVCPIACEGITS